VIAGGTFVFAADVSKPKAPTMAGVLAASQPGDWRPLDPEQTLYVEFASGRVVQGMELLSGLPRGGGPMGFYDKAEQRVPIKSIRVAADVPEAERSALEVLRTDTATFQALIESRRNRHEEWFQFQAGHIELGNVPIPVRVKNVVPR
jgi:hypothetical protein